jgi:hypothetical protein
MTIQKGHHLNQLLQTLPPGVLVDSAWLQNQGLSRSRIHDYVAHGWLERLMPRVYRRPTPASQATTNRNPQLRWELAVASAQALVEDPFHVGGATALDLLGLSHFLDLGRKNRVWLYDARHTAPTWLARLPVDVELVLNRRPLFRTDEVGLEWRQLELSTGRVGGGVTSTAREEPWDQFLRMSGAERATLELLQEVGAAVGFHTADRLFEGLANLRPTLLTRLLNECTSVKAKRLFFFFADRHAHAWAKRLDPEEFDLGRGRRQIVKGGRLHPKYEITVPADLMPDEGQQDGG